MRTIFFHAIECTASIHPHFMPSPNIGESAASVDFSLVRTAHPTAGGAVLLGVAAFLRADFATAWVMRQVTEGVIARMAGS